MVAIAASKSILLGFHVCECCGGKTHVKRKDEPGKRAYNHCLDEHDMGCSHSTHTTNATQERLLIGKMRPLAQLGTPSPSPTPEPPAAAPTPSPTPTKGGDTPKPKRSALFGL